MNLTDVFACIEKSIETIEVLLRKRNPDFIDIMKLPTYSKQDELLGDEIYTSILATRSEQPIDDTISALKKMYISDSESGRLLERRSGIVLYKDDYPELQEQIRVLNEAKSTFKLMVEAHAKTLAQVKQARKSKSGTGGKNTEKNFKFAFVHDLFPMIVTLYVYRKVQVINGGISRAYFSWLRAPKSEKMTKDQVLAHLDTLKNNSLFLQMDGPNVASIDHTIEVVSASNHDEYYLRGNQPPRPNLVLTEDGGKPKSVYPSLPVFIFGQKETPYSYSPLVSFSLEKLATRKKRVDAGNFKHFMRDLYVKEN